MEQLFEDTRTEKEKYYDLNRLEVYCGWGMADDIIIFSSYGPNTSIGMTIAQARKLMADLADAIDQAEDMQEGLNEYMKQKEKEDKLLITLLEREVG